MKTIGNTQIEVSSVGLGCWPIAGMTSLDVNETDSLATLHAARESGANFFDTAYCYGPNGESEQLIGRALADNRDQVVIATKAGIEWDGDLKQKIDGRPDTLKRQCEESLRRLRTEHVELLYLHAPDPLTPIAESAGALRELMEAGKARTIGVSNFSLEQLELFHRVCPISAIQPPYNMLQRQIESEIVPWCIEHGVSVFVYWPLLKGLLAGKLSRDHVFDSRDGRAKYPMFQGDEWEKNQDFVDELREIASEIGKTVAQLVVNWTIHQPGITAALCGAKRPYQIEETAGALGWQLSDEQRRLIDQALQRRGIANTRPAV